MTAISCSAITGRSVSISREGWLVPVDHLVGRAWLTFWPPSAWGLLPDAGVREEPPPADAESVSAAEALPAVSRAEPSTATPTMALAPVSRTLLDGPTRDQPGWLDDPKGPTRFEGTRYRLTALEVGRFVALAAPLADRFAM